MWFMIAFSTAAPPDAEATRDEMAGHWSAGVAVRDAVIERNLDKVKATASAWLKTAKATPDEIVGASREVLRPRFEALRKVKDLDTAAMEVGKLGATCGACHAQHDQNRSFLPPEPPHSRSAMDYHRAGSEWMWAGLVGRSNVLFDAGALTILSSALPASPGGSEARERAALAFESEIQRLAKTARESPGADRGELYGQLIGACSKCHVLDDGGPRHAGLPKLPAEGLLVTEMHDRYNLVETARIALRTGDVEGVKAAATSIATLPTPKGMPAQPWRPWSAEVRLRAAELSAVTSREQAAKGLGHLALACGSCHAALGGGPQVPSEDELTGRPRETEDVLWWTVLSGQDLHQAEKRATQLERLWTTTGGL